LFTLGLFTPRFQTLGSLTLGLQTLGLLILGIADPGLVHPEIADAGIAHPGLADRGLADPGIVDPWAQAFDAELTPVTAWTPWCFSFQSYSNDFRSLLLWRARIPGNSQAVPEPCTKREYERKTERNTKGEKKGIRAGYGGEHRVEYRLLKAANACYFGEDNSSGRPLLWRPVCPLLSSSMAEHPAVNRRVVGSSPT
jgi:hypothetical protein